MRLRQRQHLVSVFFALFGLLFTQFAVAGYVCPWGSKVVAATATTLPCAGDMVVDKEHVALCNAHCQPDQQSVENAQTQMPTAFVSVGAAYPIEPTKVDWTIPYGYGHGQLRSTAPPIAIRNCCFRI